MTMDTQNFDLISDSDLGQVEEKVITAFEQWCEDWGIAFAGFKHSACRAWEAPSLTTNPRWQMACVDQSGAVYLGAHTDFSDVMHQAVFPLAADGVKRNPSSISSEITLSAATDLHRQIARAFAISAEPRFSGDLAQLNVRKVASGHIHINLAVGQVAIACLVCCSAGRSLNVRPKPEQLPALESIDLQTVVAKVGVSLPVVLGEVQVELANLLALEVGDVLQLYAPLEQALNVTSESGQPLFTAFLGQIDQHVALEVATQPR